MFYTLAFLALLLSTIILFAIPAFSAAKMAARSGFLISLLLWIVSYFVEPGSWWYKLIFVLPRDLTILTVLLILVNKFAPRPKFLYFILAAGGFLGYLFFGKLVKTYDFQPDGHAEFLVELKSQSDAAAVQTFVSSFDGKATQAFSNINNPEFTELDQYWLIDFPDQYDLVLWLLKRTLGGSEYFTSVEFNDRLFASPVAGSDLENKYSFGVNDPESGKQWALEALGGEKWFSFMKDAPNPSKTALLAILDTGVDGDHEDLKGRVSGNADDLHDGFGHGTHVAGIAAALTNNGKGIASLPAGETLIRVMSVKVLSANGTGSEASVINGVIRAADAGADVISMSLGGPSRDSYQRAMEEAVAYAARKGSIVIVAAGNDNGDAARYVPANAAGVITVSALDARLNKAYFSNSVQNVEMGIAAPGVDILSVYPDNTYKVLSGTSMATPYVASVAAMAKAYNPKLKTHDLWRLMAKTGSPTKQIDQTGVFIQPEELLKTILSTL